VTEPAGPETPTDPLALIGKTIELAPGSLDVKMGLEILEASPERVVARMPVEGNTQPYGLLHGGASCVLIETVGSIGSALWAGPDRIAVGVDLNATHHRGPRAGWITAVGTPAYQGRTAATYEVTITGDDGKRVCTGRLTCAIRDRPAS
jgi:1,4-dihydroxy-2-naphthoyl-CoA hydrolase